jgi:hypothetical protein
MTLQTTHNTTTTSLQRELDTLRQEHQRLKVQLRDLELGNDDLERNERAVSSSLADMEAKYSRALEEKILLEHELLEKASLEEEAQRLRDELRGMSRVDADFCVRSHAALDAMVEISILKDQVESSLTKSPPPPEAPIEVPHPPSHIAIPSEDNLLDTAPPPDLQLDDLSPNVDDPSNSISPVLLPIPSTISPQVRRPRNQITPINGSKTLRSITMPSLQSPTANSRNSGVPPLPQQLPITPRVATVTVNAISKNKGVQMVSEMRARVRNLEQKIHTRVPRLRMGSITGKSTNTLAMSTAPPSSGPSSASSSSSRPSTAKTSWESLAQRRSGDSKRSNSHDSGPQTKLKDTRGDSSGWVLILEDSPSPPKSREKRRISSPTNGTATVRVPSSRSIPSPTASSPKPNPLGQSIASSGLRRPQSRLSATSLNTASSSSIPTPTSRPATPTHLPMPSAGLYSTSSSLGYKRSTGPNSSYSQTKRASLGSSNAHDDLAMLPPPRPATGTPASSMKYVDNSISLPPLPALHANITIRPPNKTNLNKANGISAALGQSRIGRPGGSGRRSTDNMTTFRSATSTRAG